MGFIKYISSFILGFLSSVLNFATRISTWIGIIIVLVLIGIFYVPHCSHIFKDSVDKFLGDDDGDYTVNNSEHVCDSSVKAMENASNIYQAIIKGGKISEPLGAICKQVDCSHIDKSGVIELSGSANLSARVMEIFDDFRNNAPKGKLIYVGKRMYLIDKLKSVDAIESRHDLGLVFNQLSKAISSIEYVKAVNYSSMILASDFLSSNQAEELKKIVQELELVIKIMEISGSMKHL